MESIMQILLKEGWTVNFEIETQGFENSPWLHPLIFFSECSGEGDYKFFFHI